MLANQKQLGPQWKLSDFDFALPTELIAQHPSPQRSASALLDGQSDTPKDRFFKDLPNLLKPGDLLLLNDTKVINARLLGQKKSGGKVELLVERVLDDRHIVAHMRVSRKPLAGSILQMDGGFEATVLRHWPTAQDRLFLIHLNDDPYYLMEQYGHLPLPPYIKHKAKSYDHTRYQTLFAKNPGAIAVPTAALHFDEATFTKLKARGVELAYLTLHIGYGTFAPVKTEDIRQHPMHYERYSIPPDTQQAIKQTRERKGRIIAVGTTTVRSIESWAATGHAIGETNLFITPGFRFAMTDLLITNFHLPKSTLMMLVCAFAGYQKVMALYQHAIHKQYRFFSYGDAMLLELTP